MAITAGFLAKLRGFTQEKAPWIIAIASGLAGAWAMGGAETTAGLIDKIILLIWVLIAALVAYYFVPLLAKLLGR